MTSVSRLSPEAKTEVGQAWIEAGLGEHASVAAFARFVLHLLSLGAPASLVRDAIRAMDDEVEHACLCFGVARRFIPVAAGPGPLDLTAVFAGPDDPKSILEAAILEGCIAETISARCAKEALARLQDSSIEAPLTRIASDESRHADLSWDFVRWMLKNDPTLIPSAVACFERALGAPPACVDQSENASTVIEEFGHLLVSSRSHVAHNVVENEIKPLRDAMFHRAAAASG